MGQEDNSTVSTLALKALRGEVLRLAHHGHQVIVKMKARLRTKVWWPKIDSDAERMCKSCHGCQVVVARIDGKNWREELQKFLLAYRTTPQTSTGVTPAFLMFGRELKTKLPELRCAGNPLDEGVRYRDWNHKLVHKEHADNKRGATESPVAPGDLVLQKNTKTSGKLEANFENEPYTLHTKEGSKVTVRSKEDVEYRHNNALVKPYNPPGELPEATEAISQDGSYTLSLEENITTSRPRRTVRMPEKYKNYLLYGLNSVDTLDLC
ncbi:Uncharacterized protein K02A2.6 [Stylophora pistillata]|uniref:Uncharacterized protein K02A2.6 n=1 Tax=Stylophora pistillata TaxID=50429 RepID=A0A2B4RJU1_STYPI|nr:Uncharacterized protein K02A2.6 [Stylophora pistillata]